MARGAGEPSAKRAKVDEADEEEDPLVRRKEELVRLLKEARSREDARAERVAKKELVALCADFEAKNEEHFRRLPPELWQKIVDENVQQNDLLALAMICRFFREKQKDLGKKLVTDLNYGSLFDLRKSGKVVSHSLGWFQWVCDTFEILPGCEWDAKERVEGAVYEGDLVNYAALQGSIEILRWLMEEKGYEFNRATCEGAAFGGHLDVLKFLRAQNPPCPWDGLTCLRAAQEGHLEVLKFLRGLEPPCPWSLMTCALAAQGGHLEVLKWVRDQDPPCPWNEWTCVRAARGGSLDVLKWLRAQQPPCPWSAGTCLVAAQGGHLEVLKWARSQNLPCRLDEVTCASAAAGGHLEVLKWLRSQDPPCPWSAGTCSEAAKGGRLEVLKWARSQDPPCPWDEETCAWAAEGGHLEVMKFARGQDPPCPWSRRKCREGASLNGYQHIIDWIDQQEAESDTEYRESSDSDSDRSYDSSGDESF
ncbi:putative ankyrin repeat protein [Chloropicon roscoffensis]|uniref:Ankyrin repeat protein n=1 Tax=Chloropicon roscoffensis TaxID=1461544 RepID=A0AAX4PIP0_9CHLO